ncbi:MAG: ABC transporter ATP-binding protein [Synechococcus sp. SB0662_bin_45]|uniref:ABC transporter ATP-binding protein n=1 Tax=Synechococcus sp. SB0676_bin_10 TaxID=2604869 RepID=A0A6B1FBX6_9SYNE|nr:ABC transporter ATP-binding protein [Synechococcus sp. SB0668_bin_13]MYE21988.1 ABC transporter ATP-binding protein [Synechococcus sp. SB0662_bin_45]MYG37822.1 ABC transporter ATP-binding protein [Synechococcus sp. SB0676_bin_10]MYG64659.1 ABC transporter ATP-binding protein [Synechococcus sp. SB0675_bin_7]MYK07034.1 ABC transporter ATP-binding protein [Synechococcus sp. SB0670_bin_20]MYK85719.1 ABC transporter ATP-binding protein [Synechococcus sp. SB0669_bin_7]
MASVEFRHCRKAYPPRAGETATEVLKGIDLTVADGEFLVLVGPSGCGKTTLLRLLAGLESLSVGDVLVAGRSVQHLSPAQRNVAMVFQSYALYPHLSVAQNLAFGLRRSRPRRGLRRLQDGLAHCTAPWPRPLRVHSRREAAIQQRVREVAAMLDLGQLLQRRPRELSGGQKQRVALGRAIAREPAVFLMDEPLSNLDAKLRGETRLAIAQLQKTLGTTTIYVTHDQVEAMTMGHRIAVLHHGALQQVGTPRQLYNQPVNLFVARFIGHPPMNLLPATPTPTGLMLDGQALPLSERLRASLAQRSGPVATAGIRAEALHVGAPQHQAGAPNSLAATVVAIEALGHEQLLGCRLATGQQLVQVRAAANLPMRLGDNLTITPDPDAWRLFDDQGKAQEAEVKTE